MDRPYYKLLLLLVVLVVSSCAKRGTITGGSKDTLAPILKVSLPKNGTVNFQGKEIKLVFDEYVKLKGINKQLIVSPPMKTPPEIFPQNASKTITIKIKDTLQPNTTYSFNFGQSIEDNNEGNPYSQFKYVFSTGSYIDSLKLNVKIKDALEKKSDNFVTVMLYEKNEKFNDSTIYKEFDKEDNDWIFAKLEQQLRTLSYKLDNRESNEVHSMDELINQAKEKRKKRKQERKQTVRTTVSRDYNPWQNYRRY